MREWGTGTKPFDSLSRSSIPDISWHWHVFLLFLGWQKTLPWHTLAVMLAGDKGRTNAIQYLEHRLKEIIFILPVIFENGRRKDFPPCWCAPELIGQGWPQANNHQTAASWMKLGSSVLAVTGQAFVFLEFSGPIHHLFQNNGKSRTATVITTCVWLLASD